VSSTTSRHQIPVADAIRKQLDGLDIEVVAVGARPLKGLSEEVGLFELHREGLRRARVMDPVCGMELDEATAEANLAWHGQRLLFCSEPCLRRFLDNPERYEVRSSGG